MTTSPQQVGMIGLGAMGSGIAHRLLSQGYPTSVWNRTAGKAAALEAAGARVAATPREAAMGADAVLVSVADGNALSEVLDGADGALAGLAAGSALINMSTVAPAQVQGLAAAAGRLGVAVLDAGVLGNAIHARSGELRVYVGGDAETLARCWPLLDCVGKEVVHVGDLGAGMELKLALNLIMGLELQALSEAVAFGVGRGLDRAVVLEAIAGSGFSSPVMSFKARRMAARRYGEPDFRLSLMAKDLALVDHGAATAGISLPLAASARRTHDSAVAAGLGDLDCAAIMTPFEAARNGHGPRESSNGYAASESTTERNKVVVTRAEDAWNEGNLDEAFSYFADDYEDRTPPPMPGLPKGKQGLMVLLRAFREAFPDGEVAIDVMIAEGDLVCYHSTARGTHEGEFLGIAPTGRSVEVGAIHIHRVVDGKIVEHWGRSDQLALMRQLGVAPGGPR